MVIKIGKCKYCGESFKYEVKKGMPPGFCCEDHRRLALNRRNNENQKKHRKCICKVCGKQYNYINGKGSAWYCSDECYRLANPLHTCKQCGKKFTHKHNSDNQFCSRICYQQYVKAHPDLIRGKKVNQLSKKPMRLTYQCICDFCGKHFETDNPKKKYCSQECCYKSGIQKAIKRNHDRNVANYKPKLIKCKECGKEFIPEFGKNNQRSFCSTDCMHAWCKRQGRRNRKMRVRGALVDKDITLKDVAMRDGNICYLCGHTVDWSDYSVNGDIFLVGSNYPSIDHVYPIAKGGKHEWSNVRLAHCHCNSEKRDKILP